MSDQPQPQVVYLAAPPQPAPPVARSNTALHVWGGVLLLVGLANIGLTIYLISSLVDALDEVARFFGLYP